MSDAGTGGSLGAVSVEIFDSAGNFVASGSSVDPSGNYTTFEGLPTGTYYALTSNGLGYINKLFDNISCPSCEVTGGTPISVTQGATTSNINFALNTGGRISGTVTNSAGTPLANVTVNIFNSTGEFVASGSTNTSGQYISGNGLPTGPYYARTKNSSAWVNELYDNQICIGDECDVTAGTPITVTAGATTQNINFALALGGRMVGRVTETSTGGALEDVSVAIFDSAGSFVIDIATDPSGNYTTLSGLPAGSYFARTFDNARGYIDKLYNNSPARMRRDDRHADSRHGWFADRQHQFRAGDVEVVSAARHQCRHWRPPDGVVVIINSSGNLCPPVRPISPATTVVSGMLTGHYCADTQWRRL